MIGDHGTHVTYYKDGNRATALSIVSLPSQRWAYVPNSGQGGQTLEIPYDGGIEGHWELRNDGFLGKRLETFYYSADGFLAETRKDDAWIDPGAQPAPNEGPPEPILHEPTGPGNLLASINLDAMGRTTYYKEYGGFDGTFERLNIVYDNAGRLQSELSVTTRRNFTTGTLETFNTYLTNTYTNGLLTRQVQDVYKNGTIGNSTADNAAADSLQDYSYTWWDGALQYQIQNDKDYNGSSVSHDWTTTYTYGSSGHIASASIQDGRPRTVSFLTDQNGMIVDRDEVDNQSGGDPRTLRYHFGGIQFGQTGNDGSDNMTYAGSIKDRLSNLQRWDEPGGAFRKGSSISTPYADFEQSYDAISGYSTASTGSTYTVNGGDTLAMIAQQVWGDSLLWYLIADANGLMGDEPLVSGQTLLIPNKVTNSRNNAQTFRVYDPNKAMGDLSPTAAKPPKKPGACAIVGKLILVAVAIAVTIATQGVAAGLAGAVLGTSATSAAAVIVGGAMAAAAGSIVSQGIGVATGLQSKFSWKDVGMAAISGAVGGAMGNGGAFGKLGAFGKIGSNLARDVLRGVASSALTQGIGVATGLQKKFDWTGVAVAGVVSGVGGAIERGLNGGAASRQIAHEAAHSATHQVASRSSFTTQVLSGLGGGIAGAMVRTAADGTSFGDNLLAVLPDVVGSTIGRMVASQIDAARRAVKKSNTDETVTAGETIRTAITADQEQRIIEQGGSIVTDGQGNVGIEGLSRKGIVEILGVNGAEGEPEFLIGIDEVYHYGDNLGYIETSPDPKMKAQGVEDGGGVRFEILSQGMRIDSEYFGMEGVGVVRLIQGSKDGDNTAAWLYSGGTANYTEIGRVSFGEALTTNDYRNVTRSYFAPPTGDGRYWVEGPSLWLKYKNAVWSRQDRAAEMWNHGGLGYIGAPIEWLSSSLTGGLDLSSSYYRGRSGWINESDRQRTDLTLFVAGGARSVVAKTGRVGSVTAVKGEASVVFNNGWRTADGKFASPLGSGRAGVNAETVVWDAIEAKPGWSVIRGQVAVRDASGQLRYYDGAAISPRERIIGLETKSGTAARTPEQRLFDQTLNSNPSNVAKGVGQSKGITVQRSTLIRVP